MPIVCLTKCSGGEWENACSMHKKLNVNVCGLGQL